MADQRTYSSEARRTSATDLQFERITRGFAVPLANETGAGGRASIGVEVASGINLIAGLWLVVAPFVMGYNVSQTGATWNDVAVGAAIVLLSLCRMLAPITSVSLSGVNLVLGAWMIVAPWLPNLNTGVTTGAVWNQVITGIVIAALAIVSGAVALGAARERRA